MRLELDTDAANKVSGALDAAITLVDLGRVAKIVDEDHGL